MGDIPDAEAQNRTWTDPYSGQQNEFRVERESTKGADSYWVKRPTPPFVIVATEDKYYSLRFCNREEVEAFVALLRGAADEAWGPKP